MADIQCSLVGVLGDENDLIDFCHQVVGVHCMEIMVPLPVQTSQAPMPMALTASGVLGLPVEEW